MREEKEKERESDSRICFYFLFFFSFSKFWNSGIILSLFYFFIEGS